MPYLWQDPPDASVRRLVIWRHRSLDARGFVRVIGFSATALLVPLLALVGRGVLWGLLPFAAAALGGLWFAMQHGWRNGGPLEQLVLAHDSLSVTRHDPGRPDRHWRGNPYWVRLSLHDRPVESYLTVSDGGRRIELGAFLTPEERRALRDDLAEALARVREAR